jgi:hypothetical protein
MIRATMILALLLGTLLAGCLGGDEILRNEGPLMGPDAGTGTVTGSIFTVDLLPTIAAQVRLVQDVEVAAETTTDPQGRYTLRNVEPGEYRLQVLAACCREYVRAVTVTADEVTNADLQLEPWTEDDLQIPRVERYEWTGFLACTLRFYNPPGPHHDLTINGVPGSFSGANVCAFVPGNATGDDFRHVFEIKPGLETLVGAMEWRAPGAALGEELALFLEVHQRAHQPPLYAAPSGHSPLQFRVDAGYVIEEYEEVIEDHDIHQYDFRNIEDNLELWFRVFAEGMVNIVYQQAFTVYWDLYYWERAPDDASALPDL